MKWVERLTSMALGKPEEKHFGDLGM